MTTGRRRRVWTNIRGTLPMDTTGQGAQKSFKLDTNFLTDMGLASMAGCTISRVHICTLITNDAGETSSVRSQLTWGIGIYSSLIDAGDFPNVELYAGDWMAYGCSIFFTQAAANLPVLPGEAAFQEKDFKSMRKISRSGISPFLVAQLGLAAIDVDLLFNISMLVLLP